MERIFDVLGHRIEVTSRCREICDAFDDIAVTAVQEISPGGSFSFDIERNQEGYFVYRDGKDPIHCADLNSVVIAVNDLVYWSILGIYLHWGYLNVHAGCATFNNKRFIFAGEKNAGKTSLSCKLLFNRLVSVHCDEKILLRPDRQIVPFPKLFRIKEGTLGLVPELKKIRSKLSLYLIADMRVYFLNPQRAGFNWVIEPGRLDTIFFLESDHANPSRIESIPSWQMAQKIARQTMGIETNPPARLATLTSVVSECECYQLNVGDLDTAVDIIQDRLI